jgi:colanic acid biosynthesis glycosyl transferase WcaI
MRVLVLAQYFPPDIGGGSTRAFNVAKGLRKKGCVVRVVTAFPHYPLGRIPSRYNGKALMFEKIEGIEIIRVWIPALPHNSVVNRILLHICFIFSSLFALPFEGKVDIIFVANPNLFSFFSALIYSFVNRKPIVRNVDDLWPEVFYDADLVKSKFIRKIIDIMAWLSYSVPVAVTPISQAYIPKIIERYRIRKEKIKTIEVGVDTTFFNKTCMHAKKNGDFVAMYSGILGAGYDFVTVLRAAKLLSSNKRISFVIRGVGEREKEIKKMIKKLNLKNVVLSTKLIPKLELALVLALADIFLLPMKGAGSADDGLPTKIFEYQALGKPIICCSRGEPARYITSTKSGLVVNIKDPDALANAILKLYNDKEALSELGLNGWNYIQQYLTVEKIGEYMYNLFKSCI